VNAAYRSHGATWRRGKHNRLRQDRGHDTIASNPPIGSNPSGIAVDQTTDTVYTANIADGEHPGTVSVINGATCNGSDTTGCSRTPAKVAVGNYPGAIAVNPAVSSAYVTNVDNTVSVTPFTR
jgi:DNA-binding beta-propeller fold protein YncE